ncbi:hypothetical protein ACFQ0B_04925 [Nonomuraea thailandensis]
MTAGSAARSSGTRTPNGSVGLASAGVISAMQPISTTAARAATTGVM